ncbi:Uncharacterized protein OBRU01_06716, partial [Operophtera brumata]
HVYPPVPEQLQLQIAFWSFPDSEDDIRLYSCLANGSADEFQRGEHLCRDRAVKDFNVAVTFDRQRIVSCNCTCSSTAHWCSHIVAVCLYRIHLKFAQYLIAELPRQVLPTAQRILDELLSAQPTLINKTSGAPDPTAGASAYEYTSWDQLQKFAQYLIAELPRQVLPTAQRILDELLSAQPTLINKTSGAPDPTAGASAYEYTSCTSAPPAAAEWSSLLRPLRGREPEGMWNLLSIIIVWWYSTKAALVAWGGGTVGKHNGTGGNSSAQHACSSLCDEVAKNRNNTHITSGTSSSHSRHSSRSSHSHPPYINGISETEVFPGFHPAMEACFLEWDDYQIPGVTYAKELNPLYHSFCENEEEILQASSGDTDSHSSSSPPVSSDDATRRISQDESVSDDECNMYFYDTAAARRMNACSGDESSPPSSGAGPSNGATNWQCTWEVSFARAEGLQAHGHAREACALGARLAKELLARPPSLTGSALSPHERRMKKRHIPIPKITKALEVKLNNQETELVALLKKLPTGHEQLMLAREKAMQIRDGNLRSCLATYRLSEFPARMPHDEMLGFESAVASLGLKANVSEAEHPLLCEGTRRQRGELAITLLSYYKDDPVKLARIMNKGTRRQRGELAITLLSYYKDDPVKLARIMNKVLGSRRMYTRRNTRCCARASGASAESSRSRCSPTTKTTPSNSPGS